MHVPVQLPCYDFIQVIYFSNKTKGFFKKNELLACDGRCVQDQDTIHRNNADFRLLVIPSSYKQISVYNSNLRELFKIN